MARTQRDPDLEQLWRRRLADQRRSGLSVRQFCRERGLTETSFHYWKMEIARRDREAAPPFVPVVVAAPVPPPSPVAETPIVLDLTTGHRLRLRSGCDRQLLADLIDLLTRSEGRPC